MYQLQIEQIEKSKIEIGSTLNSVSKGRSSSLLMEAFKEALLS